MATHRSLNKLEFKAHMSIHNFKDVEESETHDSDRTRDRFGKEHRLSDHDGTPRLKRRQSKLAVLAAAAFFSSFFCGWACADEPAPHSNTDIRVETEGLDANSWLNQKFNQPEDEFGIPINESSKIGFNDDGDPNMSTQF